jgi:hypothetical protein
MVPRKLKYSFVALLCAIALPSAAQEVIAPYPREELAIRAAVRVLTFASAMGGMRITLGPDGRVIEQKTPKIKDPERAIQESAVSEVEFIDFV